jgi:hypothetical protein
MRDTRDLISAEDLLEIFSKVSEEFRKRVKPDPETQPVNNKISKDELLEIFKKCSDEVK